MTGGENVESVEEAVLDAAQLDGRPLGRPAALVRTSVTDLEDWQTSLRSLANQLEDLAARPTRAANRELG